MIRSSSSPHSIPRVSQTSSAAAATVAAAGSALLGARSREVRHAVADRLGLRAVDVPWHTARDGVAETGFALASLAGLCGRIAREVVELSRPEIGELREEEGHHRGASSTMPQKANPIGSEAVIGMSVLAAHHAGALLAALQGTHERSAGEWQVEWDALPAVFGAAGGALAGGARIVEGLRVFPERMRANLELDGGTIMAEAAMMAVGEVLGRAEAHAAVHEASALARSEGLSLTAALRKTLAHDVLAALPPLERVAGRRVLDNGLELEERRIPVGVIGANYEARPNVTVDFATQLVKSRNAGVLRTGGASLRSASALVDRVIGPGLEAAGLKAEAIQLVRTADREAAEALVSLPGRIPLVILRGSGETTARLARLATERGVRTLAHAEGGGVLYVGARADTTMALRLIEASLDRLGVCNRLNLLLIDDMIWDSFLPSVLTLFASLGIDASLPPHAHPLGYEWANDKDRDATVTVARGGAPEAAAILASEQTSGLAAAIVTEDADAASMFIDAYRGTGAFWNASTRWLDGFELTAAPETGINVARVPGPRGPVTYRDLYLRQYVVRGDGTQHR